MRLFLLAVSMATPTVSIQGRVELIVCPLSMSISVLPRMHCCGVLEIRRLPWTSV